MQIINNFIYYNLEFLKFEIRLIHLYIDGSYKQGYIKYFSHLFLSNIKTLPKLKEMRLNNLILHNNQSHYFMIIILSIESNTYNWKIISADEKIYTNYNNFKVN